MNQDHKTRLGGLFLMIAGTVIGYLAIWRPYQAALAGSNTVSLHKSGIAVAILFPLLGAVLVAGGDAFNEHFKAQVVGKKTKLGWLYLGIVATIAIGAYTLVTAKFEALGYSR